MSANQQTWPISARGEGKGSDGPGGASALETIEFESLRLICDYL